jgi:hypothetical protein
VISTISLYGYDLITADKELLGTIKVGTRRDQVRYDDESYLRSHDPARSPGGIMVDETGQIIFKRCSFGMNDFLIFDRGKWYTLPFPDDVPRGYSYQTHSVSSQEGYTGIGASLYSKIRNGKIIYHEWNWNWDFQIEGYLRSDITPWGAIFTDAGDSTV